MIGFNVYSKFYQANHRSAKTRTIMDFIDSQNYLAFIKFGKYLQEIDAIRIEYFTDFIVRSGLPINKWDNPVVYETYVKELCKSESIDSAVERTFKLMQKWAEERNLTWTDFFKKVEPPLATLWVRGGRISPWVVYLSATAQEMLSRLSEEQVRMVSESLDPTFWNEMINSKKEECEGIQKIFEEIGL